MAAERERKSRTRGSNPFERLSEGVHSYARTSSRADPTVPEVFQLDFESDFLMLSGFGAGAMMVLHMPLTFSRVYERNCSSISIYTSIALVEVADGQNGLGHLDFIHEEHGVCEHDCSTYQ